jgi:cyclic pyranopterin phosphate synthase
MTSDPAFPHLSDRGEAHMVDVSGKEVTRRRAVAEGFVALSPEVAERLFAGTLPKGDALALVRIAGVMGAKRTADLIPLCHPLPLEAVAVEVEQDPNGARLVATVTTTGRTGVEMEAMTAVSVAALSLYDMVKGLDRGAVVGPIRLVNKSGGRSGDWTR